jgi:Protein of unknown function (DUF3467)
MARNMVADEDAQPINANVILPPEQMAGVWANFAAVSHSEHEFTLDFVRLMYGSDPLTGVVVARVSVSPLFITQLIDALNTNWQEFTRKSLPKGVYDDDENN